MNMNRGLYNLFKACTIIGAIFGGLLLANSPVYFFGGFSTHIHEMLVDAYDSGAVTFPIIQNLDGEGYATIIQGVMIGIGLFMVIIGIISVVVSVLCVRVRKKMTRALLIVLIILGFLSFDVPAIGGIIGLVTLKKQQAQE